MLGRTHIAQKRWRDWRTIQQLFSFSSNSQYPSILRIRHRSFTSFDTPNNRKADEGTNSVHDLFIHDGQPVWLSKVILHAGDGDPT